MKRTRFIAGRLVEFKNAKDDPHIKNRWTGIVLDAKNLNSITVYWGKNRVWCHDGEDLISIG